MREAQQRRWAKIRGESEPAPAKIPAKPKRKLSAAGRKAIIAAAKKRWALKRAEVAKASPKKIAKKVAVKKAGPAKAKRSAPVKKAAVKKAAAPSETPTVTVTQ
jgi:DNA-binding protein HU-beta